MFDAGRIRIGYMLGSASMLINVPFEGAVVSPESRLPFVALSDLDQMVGMLEVDFQIDFGLVQAVKEVGNAR